MLISRAGEEQCSAAGGGAVLSRAGGGGGGEVAQKVCTSALTPAARPCEHWPAEFLAAGFKVQKGVEDCHQLCTMHYAVAKACTSTLTLPPARAGCNSSGHQ